MRRFLKKLSLVIFLSLAICLFGGLAWAVPTANLTYLETALAGGLWQYNYTFFNTSSPAFDLYDVLLTFDPSKTFALVSIPTGWDSNSGAGFVDFFSQNPGTPPVGNDIAPGTSLSGFIFQFDYRAGNLPFDSTLANPNDPGIPVSVNGISSSSPSAIPEAPSLLLLAVGLVVMGGVRKWFKYPLTPA